MDSFEGHLADDSEGQRQHGASGAEGMGCRVFSPSQTADTEHTKKPHRTMTVVRCGEIVDTAAVLAHQDRLSILHPLQNPLPNRKMKIVRVGKQESKESEEVHCTIKRERDCGGKDKNALREKRKSVHPKVRNLGLNLPKMKPDTPKIVSADQIKKRKPDLRNSSEPFNCVVNTTPPIFSNLLPPGPPPALLSQDNTPRDEGSSVCLLSPQSLHSPLAPSPRSPLHHHEKKELKDKCCCVQEIEGGGQSFQHRRSPPPSGHRHEEKTSTLHQHPKENRQHVNKKIDSKKSLVDNWLEDNREFLFCGACNPPPHSSHS